MFRLFSRPDKTLPNDEFGPPTQYWADVRNSLRKKSDHNKFESQGSFLLVIFCSLSAPLFIAFGPNEFWGKVTPATLSACAAAATAWLQLRQPHKLWVLYRRAQRELEDEKVQFENKMGSYEEHEHPDKLLAMKTAKIAMGVHLAWENLVPTPQGLAGANSESSKDE